MITLMQSQTGELTTCDGDFGSDIWYIYTATCTGDVTVETCNQADYDTILAFYDGSSCANALDDSSLIICNDDTDGCGDFTSQLTAPVIVAQDYLVRVGGFKAEQGTGTISIVPEQNCTSPSPTPTPLVIIPTMGQWGMIFLTIILGVLAVIGLRRKGSQDT